MVGPTSRPQVHWLHLAPRLALWIRRAGANEFVLVPKMQILWIDDALNGQAAHVCTVPDLGEFTDDQLFAGEHEWRRRPVHGGGRTNVTTDNSQAKCQLPVRVVHRGGWRAAR